MMAFIALGCMTAFPVTWSPLAALLLGPTLCAVSCHTGVRYIHLVLHLPDVLDDTESISSTTRTSFRSRRNSENVIIGRKSSWQIGIGSRRGDSVQ